VRWRTGCRYEYELQQVCGYGALYARMQQRHQRVQEMVDALQVFLDVLMCVVCVRARARACVLFCFFDCSVPLVRRYGGTPTRSHCSCPPG
jgi:hypothetical protein